MKKESNLKCGLEIHQRLDTHKLFCNCPSIEGNEVNKKYKRKLNVVKSEISEVDKTAQFEKQKNTDYIYEFYPEVCCELEIDECPPLKLNQEALDIVLEIALNLNSNIVDEVHFMRKQVIDGSNTSGFQRTAIIATGGYIESSKGKVSIETICLEEESSGIIKKEIGQSTFRLDRLGIPLIEISTGPDIIDPEHAQEIAKKIGMILRVTGKVQRGLGTIRQDVNVSIPEGARVEIKGAQELDLIPKLIENEIKRQENLKKLLDKLKNIQLNEQLGFCTADVTEIFEETESKFIKTAINNGEKIFALKLEKHNGILGIELLPNIRYGTELSQYAKTAGVKGIIHSDENLEKYKINDEEIFQIKLSLDSKKEDAFVLVAAPEQIAINALYKVLERVNMHFIPLETRRADKDLSYFMRPIAGKARMYPETDIPPQIIDTDRLNKIKNKKGKGLEDTQASLEKMLNMDLAKKMLKSKYLQLFIKLTEEGYDPLLVANTLEQTLTELRREGVNIEKITDNQIIKIFTEYKKGRFTKKAIGEILRYTTETEDIDTILKTYELNKITGKNLEKIIENNHGNIGEIMKKYRLNIEPEEIQSILKNKNKKL
ncbi:Glu-tRNA(Gln) amidotransferase subunit GatE [Candidatus Micrarchaeota archaeon]|nr:Glu-tRNA(Gln) amidotransferase subunit GatE [Candidatus Micrarchaeota archaeon]